MVPTVETANIMRKRLKEIAEENTNLDLSPYNSLRFS